MAGPVRESQELISDRLRASDIATDFLNDTKPVQCARQHHAVIDLAAYRGGAFQHPAGLWVGLTHGWQQDATESDQQLSFETVSVWASRQALGKLQASFKLLFGFCCY